MTSPLQELIERLEKEGPSLELDINIHAAIFRPQFDIDKIELGGIGDRIVWKNPMPDSGHMWEYCTDWPHYIASIDDALTLARNQDEVAQMLYAAYLASRPTEGLWESIKAALLTSLRARQETS